LARWVLLLCASFQILQLHLIIRKALAGELAWIEACFRVLLEVGLGRTVQMRERPQKVKLRGEVASLILGLKQ
jgi:hypothetical protein